MPKARESFAMATGLRETGIDVLGKVPWGKHFCLFYETKEDLLDMVVPYCRAGLVNQELCIWAISEPLTEVEARDALKRAVPDFNRYLADRSIEIISGREWHPKGKGIDPKRITEGWHEKLGGALTKGYEGLRVSANALRLSSDSWQDFCEYEQELDEVTGSQRMIVLCTCPLAESRPEDILDRAREHKFTAVRRKGVWEVIESGDAQVASRLLTPREIEVLTWVARGKSAKEIAQLLKISKRTVDEHTQDAIRRLGAANRTQAVAIALREHIISV